MRPLDPASRAQAAPSPGAPTPPTSADPEKRRNAPLRAVFYMAFAALLFPLLNASVKYLGPRFPMPEILWVRYTGHVALCLLIFLPSHGLALFRTVRPGIQVARAMLLFVASCFFFLGVQTIALPTATTIAFVGPIIVTALSMPMLRERVGPRRWTAVLVGFVGAAIIIRPGADVIEWGAVLVLCDATAYALYQILSRKVGNLDSAPVSITLAGIGGLIFSSIALPFSSFVLPTTLVDGLVLALVGVWGLIAHFCVIKAYQWGRASVVAPLGYGELLGAVVIGWFLFGELPDAWTLVGGAVIIASGLYILYREQKLQAARNAAAERDPG